MQNIGWLTRKIINSSPITLHMRQWTDEATGLAHLDIENRPDSGLPGTKEERVLNWEPSKVTSQIFGELIGRTRYISPADLKLQDEDEALSQGWEPGLEELVQMQTEHVDAGALTKQVCGFELLDGKRYHTRHVVVTKAEQVLKVRVVYDYLGPNEK